MNLSDILKDGMTKQNFYFSVKQRFALKNQQLTDTASYVKVNQSVLAGNIQTDANLALEGMLVLPGTVGKPYFVGIPPSWHANPVQDNEFLWVLNRMEHWGALLQAYLMKVETDYIKYAQKVTSELLDWIDKCPRPAISNDMAEMHKNFDSPTPWRSLEAGIRMFKTWPAVITYLVSSGDHFTPDLLERFAISVYEHTEVLHSVSPRFYPNADHNHYLMEMLGLYAAMVQFPEFKVSTTWKNFAKGELVRCVEKQITDGGGQIEGSPHYHNETLYYFYLAQMIAVSDGDNFPSNYIARLDNAINYTLHTLRPTGLNVPWVIQMPVHSQYVPAYMSIMRLTTSAV